MQEYLKGMKSEMSALYHPDLSTSPAFQWEPLLMGSCLTSK